jgi:hypothetical protein
LSGSSTISIGGINGIVASGGSGGSNGQQGDELTAAGRGVAGVSDSIACLPMPRPCQSGQKRSLHSRCLKIIDHPF